MLRSIGLLLKTVRYLQVSQLVCQLLNRLKRGRYVDEKQNRKIRDIDKSILVKVECKVKNKYLAGNNFFFLNLQKDFGKQINWNYLEYGKLWNYNLEYFDYLNQENIPVDEKWRLINDFYSFSVKSKRPLEPYPVSLRAINLMRFTLSNNVNKQGFRGFLYQELRYLNNNLEYHVLGNHLLENAFALCLGGAFFSNEKWHRRAVKILRRELEEQIHADGAHFELSPMYHKIIFFRLLELIDWYSTYNERENTFLVFCRQKASLMLDWLENISFENGDIPLFNDSANGIAYEMSLLRNYAKQLGVNRANISLGDSGYRSFGNEFYEIKMDLAQIGASYQPGHAHADALSFILYYQRKPLFVEQGTSTYQIGERRNLERSTEAHNTVAVRGENQSEVWGGFRVGQRAKTTILDEHPNLFVASHDGYKKYGIIHKRTFSCSENEMKITDSLLKKDDAVFYLHLHPSCTLSRNSEQQFLINNGILVSFEGASRIVIEEYDYAESYNQYERGKRLVVSFEGELSTVIVFEQS